MSRARGTACIVAVLSLLAIVYAEQTNSKISFLSIRHDPSILGSEFELLSVEQIDVEIVDPKGNKAKLTSKITRNLPWKGNNFDAEMHFNGKLGLYVTHFEQYADSNGKKRGSRLVFFSPLSPKFDKDLFISTRGGDCLTILTLTIDAATGDMIGVCVGLIGNKQKYYVYVVSPTVDGAKASLALQLLELKISDIDKLSFAWRSASAVVITRQDETIKNLPKRKFLVVSLPGGRNPGFPDEHWQMHVALTNEKGVYLTNADARMIPLEFRSGSEHPTNRFPRKLEVAGEPWLRVAPKRGESESLKYLTF